MDSLSSAPQSTFAAISRLYSLGDGRRRTRVIVGTTSDVRTAAFLFESHVVNNRLSAGSYPKYPKGYIRFENGKVFDVGTSSVDGIRVYIFLYRFALPYWSRHLAEQRLTKAARLASSEDLSAVLNLATTDAGLPRPWTYTRDDVVAALATILSALNVRQVIQLAEALEDPTDRAA